MNLKLVIFDMDGLMYDTEQIGMDCLINAAQKFGYVIDQEFGLSSIGMNANDYQKLVKEKFGADNFKLFCVLPERKREYGKGQQRKPGENERDSEIYL